ncbi:transcriptional regulator with XRE-family HTH domain [Roseateles asaccharophilus]|uniref:helix-turn-helix domain-containing protein n=1 Tax=Roseateles asaccharophilus TaxID=582607 RepID=UPI003833F1D3
MQIQVDPELTAPQAGDRNYGLGRVMRDLRKGAGATHAEVAAAMDLGRTSVCNMERGVQAITVEKLYQFADHLDVEVTISFKPKKRGAKKAMPGITDVVLSGAPRA